MHAIHRVVERRTGDVAVNYADPSHAEKVLKWKAKFGLTRMCADLWRWQQQNPLGFGKKKGKQVATNAHHVLGHTYIHAYIHSCTYTYTLIHFVV